MALRREPGRPIWRQIADTVQSDIRQQALKPGDRLPTEAALAERFGVNRHTVRQAIAFLQERGQIQVEQGRGSFVARDPLVYPVGKRTRFTEIVRLQHRMPGGTLVRVRTVAASAHVARDLGVAQGALLHVLDILHTADGQPICLAAHHFPQERVPDLEPGFRASGSITAALAQVGIPNYVRKSTRLLARHPTSHEVRLLDVARTRPVLVTEAVNTLPDGTAIEFGLACFPADRVQILVETE